MPNYMWREPNRAQIQNVFGVLFSVPRAREARARPPSDRPRNLDPRAIQRATSTHALPSGTSVPERTRCQLQERLAAARGMPSLHSNEPAAEERQRTRVPSKCQDQMVFGERAAHPLAPLVRQLGRMPTFPEMEARGHEDLANRIRTFGGRKRVAAKLKSRTTRGVTNPVQRSARPRFAS